MTKIAIVYFSGYGHTQKQAEAVHAGASSVEGADVKLFRINEEGDLGEGEFDEDDFGDDASGKKFPF